MRQKQPTGYLSSWQDFDAKITNGTGNVYYYCKYRRKRNTVDFTIWGAYTISDTSSQAKMTLPVPALDAAFYTHVLGFVTDNGSSMSVVYGINDGGFIICYHTLSGIGNAFQYGVSGFYECAGGDW